MKKYFRLLRTTLAVVQSEWAGALPAVPIQGTDAEGAIDSMSDAGLVRYFDALSAHARATGAMQAAAAGEMARRSRRELGSEGLAKSQGFATPAALIAQSTGDSVGDALKLMAVGEATAGRQSFTGERMPSAHPFVHDGVQAGDLSVAAAALITRMLDRVAMRAVPQQLVEAEEMLVALAAQLNLEMLGRVVKKTEAALDPDGVEPREDLLRAGRSLSIVEEGSGAIVLHGRFDPVNGAPIKVFIEAIVGAELRRARDAFGSSHECICVDGESAGGEGGGEVGRESDGCGCADPDLAEQRTISQMRADALADLARHALGCDEVAVGTSAAVVVRMDVEDLQSPDSAGVASIDGIDQPISAESARCLAASAGIIPLVLGGASVPLDLGRTQRLFSKLQKIALAERDGGCAHPGCSRPPSYCDAHHIRWWDRDAGPTDIANGVLLCSHHHHLLHREGWVIQVVENCVWFIPAAHIDPEQRPRPGNNTRRVRPAEPAADSGAADSAQAA